MFPKNLVEFIWVRQVRYHESMTALTIQNLKSQVEELVRRPRTLMKYSNSVGSSSFPKITGDKTSI